MAERDDKTRLPGAPPIEPPVVEPFAADGADDWENELDAWDRALPIVAPAGNTGPIGAAENPFQETPTTVVSENDPDDAGPPSGVVTGPFSDALTPSSGSYAALVTTDDERAAPAFERAPGTGAGRGEPSAYSQMAIPSGTFDDGASQSGSYAALVADVPVARLTTIFDTPPPDESAVTYPSETLPEMGAALWEGEASATLTIGPAAAGTAPDVETWRELGQMVEDELAKADTTERRAELALAAARLAEILGDPSGARGYVERALANDRLMGVAPAGWTAAHRARLCLAERSGTINDDAGAAESLARLALLPHPDQAAYRALQAEWTLVRVARGVPDGSAAGLVAGLPDGVPRTLGEAELAWRDPAAAAAILATAGHARGDALGAALLVVAAARNEVLRDFEAAADQRATAAAIEPGRLFPRAGLLRDAVRQSSAGAGAAIQELLPLFAPSPLKVTLALWAAELVARGGSAEEAWSLVAESAALGPVSPALVRDRVSLRMATGRPIALAETQQLLGPLLEQFGQVPARVLAAGFACTWAGDDEARTVALERVEALRESGVDVAALGPAVEALAAGASAPALRQRALRLWRACDPARWWAASHSLALSLAAASEGDAAEAVAVELAARSPRAPLFLARAARAARAGRFAAAAALLDSGAAAWTHTRLGGPLRELAAERLARVDVAAACDRLEALAGDDAEPVVRLTLGRALRALRDGARWLAYVRRRGGEGDTAARRASLLLEPHFWNHGAGASDGALDEAFELVPLHPVALGLSLAARATVATLADRWVAAAQLSPAPATALEAALLLSASGAARPALDLLLSRLPAEDAASSGAPAGDPLPEATRDAIRRLVWAEGDAGARAAVLKRIGRPEEPIPASVQLIDTMGPGDEGRADVVATAPAEPSGDRLAALERATRAARWPVVVERLLDAPPSGLHADPDTMSLALDLEAAHPGASARASGVLASLVAPAPGAEVDAPSPALAFHAFARALPATPGSVPGLEAAAALATRLSDGRSAALFLVAAAHADSASAERLLRAAVTRDPASAPAASALRRLLVRQGRLAEAADASGAEADALVELPLRVEALVRAAALIRSSASVRGDADALSAAAGKAAQRAAALFLRRALALGPDNAEVFGRLRELYDEAGEHAALAELLSERLTVTSNPFETTALHLARAELFAGPLGDPAAARAELATILAKEPIHARALVRLADLEESQGNYAATAELLVQRSAGERSPEKLRELFLRLGRIHVQHLPDAKRAVAAFSRVLQLDAKNREALDALSLLYVERGDLKNATAMTERLLTVEDSPARRVVYHVRLGQVAERGGDQLATLEHFRRGVDESPRDISAITELARYLDKVHDLTSRRHMLDTAAGQLRAAVLARPAFAGDREALATVQRLRGRPAAADAALELGSFLASAEGAVPVDETVARRAEGRPARLTALATPALDDRLFPASVPPSVRHLFRMLAPIERATQRPDLGRWGAERGHRVAEGRGPREAFDRVAAGLAVGAFELYVTPARQPPPLVALPGKPPAIVVGASLLQGGPAAIRFVAGRTLRLTSSSLDLALAGGEGDLAAWLTGVIRQFVPTYQRADVSPDAAASATARMARQLPKKSRPELLPFALESSGELNVAELMAGIREGADRVGLLASGSLAAGLGVLFAAAGERVTAEALRDFAEARALVEFALSDEHDDLLQLLGDGAGGGTP